MNEDLIIMRGKLNIHGTIKNKINHNIKLNCDYDELSENNLYNQIIKTTIQHLLALQTVNIKRKQQLKKIIIYLEKFNFS